MNYRILSQVACATVLASFTLAACAPSPKPKHESTPPGLATSDWSSIRAAYDAGRHAAVAVDGGFQAQNPGQHWLTRFDGRGFTTKPDSGDWSWGLELMSYGVAGQACAISGYANVKSEGSRVEYDWDSNLTEWYVNDTRGLEHGYTVHRRPASGQGPLQLNLAVRGDLRPVAQSSSRGVDFVNADDLAVLDYSGLTVNDSSGLDVPATIYCIDDGVQICIDDRNARYPLTVDPIAQQAYLKASNTGAFDFFGAQVSVSGNTVVVGAHGEDSNATGVNGNQSDETSNDSGAVYVFVRSGIGWVQQAYLKASNTGGGDKFGYSVSISGDTILVSALEEDSNAIGVNGNQSDNSSPQSGAAYVFVRNGTTWSQQAYLKASNAGGGDSFGESVSISGDTAIVGARLEDSDATGVNGNQSSNGAGDSGAAYILVRNGTTWSQQAYVKASNTGASDYFGHRVSISGDTAVVGAFFESSNATGVNGDQSSNTAGASGAAYIFVRNGTTWSQQAYVKASNTTAGDWFGVSLSASGDTVLIGAPNEDSNATGVNGNQGDNSSPESGAAYVFVRNGTAWSQQAYLKASNTGNNDAFGDRVSISGRTVIVGARNEDSNSTGVNGNQVNNSFSNSGAAYAFVQNGTTWSQQAYLKASNTGSGDWFAWSVAVSGDLVVVGAAGEASSATGVNGNQIDNNASGSGASYIIDLDNNPGTVSYGTGTPGCNGTHTLDVNHAPMINSPGFAITCSNAPASSLGLGVVTDSQDLVGSDPFSLGVLQHVDFSAATEVIAFDFVSDASGSALSTGTTIPNDVALIGKKYYAEALWVWTSCALPPFNFSSSRGLAITIQAP